MSCFVSQVRCVHGGRGSFWLSPPGVWAYRHAQTGARVLIKWGGYCDGGLGVEMVVGKEVLCCWAVVQSRCTGTFRFGPEKDCAFGISCVHTSAVARKEHALDAPTLHACEDVWDSKSHVTRNSHPLLEVGCLSHPMYLFHPPPLGRSQFIMHTASPQTGHVCTLSVYGKYLARPFSP